MAWQDRPYYRDRSPSHGGVLGWLMTGSVPLFTIFGVRVRAHASLIVFIGLVLLFGLGRGFTLQDRVMSMAVLFGIVLLHEFGHIFACRWVGGSADEITMHPLGGVAWAAAPRRPWPTFITVIGGPAVNVIICAIAGAIMIATGPAPNLNPFDPEFSGTVSWFNAWYYATWIYQISYWLLLFNLLPIYPLDGGQLLMSIMWPHTGYYRAMMISTATGMGGAVLLAMVGVATASLLLILIAIFGFINCLNMRRMLKAQGPYGFEEDEVDYSAAYDNVDKPKAKRFSRWKQRKVARLMDQEKAEQAKVDAILAKVSSQGMQSLTWTERRALRKATEHQRQRDQELQRTYREQGF